MSNRSYVIAQTFINSWRVLPKTFVNSVSSKRVVLPLTKARIGLERQRQTRAVWAKRTEYSIEQIRQSLQRLKIAKIVRMQNLHNFRTIDSVFFRHTLAIQVVNHWPTPIANSLRSGTRHAACSRARVPRNHPPNQEGRALVSAMTYEQLFICRLSNLPRSIVSIVLRKLAIVNTSSHKQEWTFVHSVVLHLIHQKFN
mgnify:CR=1 FL=1